MLFKSYELMIALRFLLKGKLQTILIISGISIGVAVQFFLSALIGGLQISLIDKTVGTAAHIIILPADTFSQKLNFNETTITDSKKSIYIENQEIISWKQYVEYLKKDTNLTAVNPVVSEQGFIEKGNTSNSVLVKGITSPDGDLIYKFKKNLKNGYLELNGDSVYIGQSLSDKLQINIGDKIFIRNGKGNGDFFNIAGIIDLGSTQANNIVFLTLDRARIFFEYNGVTSIEIQIKDIFKSNEITQKYRNEFSRIKIESWQERNKELLTALRSQSSSSNIIQFFVLFSISLGIASVLGIAAVQKSKQLGILKAMGVDNRGAGGIFLIQGLILGFIGALAGIIIGLLLGLLFINTSGINSFDLDLSLKNIISPVILAILASSLASIIPARRASKLSPIEVIRNG